MNTPSNAGKELLPCPFCGGLPLVNYERIVCEDCRIGSEPEQPGCSILSLTERWNRRTTPPTRNAKCPKCGGKGWIFKGHGEDEQCDCIFVDPPTQSQEGETPESDELYTGRHPAWIDSYNLACKLERQRNAAQRENDRLRSEVALIEWQNQEKLTVTWNHLHGAFIVQGVNQVCGNMGRGPTVIEALRAARAATEEGKRG